MTSESVFAIGFPLALTIASCTYDPSIDLGYLRAGFDAYTGTGTGTYNGVSGARAEWTFTDAREPGRGADHVRLVIQDANNNTVLSVNDYLDGGNQQAHR